MHETIQPERTFFFRIFMTPDCRWSWALWRSDMTAPLAHGREFATRDEAVANTVAVQEAAAVASWVTELDAHLEKQPV